MGREDTQTIKRYTKSCSTIPDIKEMQIKTKTRYHLTPVTTPIV